MVTNYGKIQKEIADLEKFKQHHYEILAEIMLTIENEEPICTYSLDMKNFIFSICYADENNPNLNSWYQRQIKDEILTDIMEIGRAHV